MMADSKPQVHQFVAVLDKGDAIGNHALAIREFMRGQGYSSEIFAWRAGKGMRHQCRHYLDYIRYSSSKNIVIYHFGVSSPITGFFLQAPDRKVIVYHNITPESFFRGVSDRIYHTLKNGRRELAQISGKIQLAIAVSEYNRQELARLGFKNTATVPLLLDFGLYKVAADSSISSMYDDGYVNIIFVGRISPNKKQEDIIRAFSMYKKYINSRSRLFIIGQNRQVPEYNTLLKCLVEALGVKDVHLTGAVSQAELNAYYSIADVFVSMSEHEGFCIPLLESMYFGVPIIAYDSSAVASTLGGTGILFTKKDSAAVAELLDLVINDGDLRERVIKAQKIRLESFMREKVEKQLMNTLAGLLKE